jgi:hypothetical protein
MTLAAGFFKIQEKYEITFISSLLETIMNKNWDKNTKLSKNLMAIHLLSVKL